MLTGCMKEDNTTEGRIAKAMKEYAKKNFDDPKSLVEVPLIEANEEIIDARELAIKTLEASAKLDSICEARGDSVVSGFKKITDNLKNGKIRPIKSKIDESFEYLIRLELWGDKLYSSSQDKNLRDFYYNEVDSLVKNLTLYPITTYNINARVKENGELKIKHFYTWSCDTTTVFKIYDEPLRKDNLKNENLIIENVNKLLDYGTKRQDFIEEGVKLLQDFTWLVE